MENSYVSAAIQINTNTAFASGLLYLHVFDGLEQIHHQMDPAALTDAKAEIGYHKCLQAKKKLPDEKGLVRLDFCRKDPL